MKAWAVRDTDYESACVVFAETRGKARRKGVAELDEEWCSIRVKRAPEFDDLAPGPVTERQYVERGYWVFCDCGAQRPPDSEEMVTVGDAVYCSEKCWERFGWKAEVRG